MESSTATTTTSSNLRNNVVHHRDWQLPAHLHLQLQLQGPVPSLVSTVQPRRRTVSLPDTRDRIVHVDERAALQAQMAAIQQQEMMRAHAASLDEALRTRILGPSGARESHTYPHHHPGAPAMPFPRSPPNEQASLSEVIDAVAGQDTIKQSSIEPIASSALPGAHTTSADVPLGAETVHLPTSILPAHGHHPRARRPPPDEASSEPVQEYVEILLERSRTLKGTISGKILPRPCDLTDEQLQAYIAQLDVVAVLGNTQPGLPRQRVDPLSEEGAAEQRAEVPPPPPLRPRRYHQERRKRIPELRARIAYLTAQRDDMLSARGHSCPPEIEHDAVVVDEDTNGAAPNSPERPLLPRRALSEGGNYDNISVPTWSPTQPSESSETLIGTSAEGDSDLVADSEGTMIEPVRAPPPITISPATPSLHGYDDGEYFGSESEGADEIERERLMKMLDDLSAEIAALTATAERLEKVREQPCPLSLQLGKNKNVSRGSKDDELWNDCTGVAPGVRRFSAYGHSYELHRHVLSPVMSECTEAPTLSPMSSIDGLSMASSRSARSARSGRSSRSVASSTTSQKLRKESRSILQALTEEVPALTEQRLPAAGLPLPDVAAMVRQDEASNGEAYASPTPSEVGSDDWKQDVERWTRKAAPLDLVALQRSSEAGDLLTFSPNTSPRKAGRSPPPTIASRRKLSPTEIHSRHTSLSSNATGSSTLSLFGPVHATSHQQAASQQSTHRKPPAALKTRRALVLASAGETERTHPLSVAREMELAGVALGSPPGIRRVGEAIVPESPRNPQSPPFGESGRKEEVDMPVVPKPEAEMLPPAYEASDTSCPPLMGAITDKAASPHLAVLEPSTTPSITPPRSPLLRDLEIPEIRVESPSTPAKSLAALSNDGRLSRVPSSSGQKRHSLHSRSASLQLPMTEKQALRQAKEEAKQQVWAQRTEFRRCKIQFEDERNSLWDRMSSTRSDAVRALAHWDLAELYIGYSDTVGMQAGLQGTKMMQECLARYEEIKADPKRWARYGQMHVWLRRNGSGAQQNGGEQHLNLAVNAFTNAMKIAGDTSEFGGHCCMLAAQVLQEGATSSNQYYQAYQYWLRAVSAVCNKDLDVRYAQLASCCDVMVSETLAGRCQGQTENWRVNCIDAMRRACSLAPDNEEWKTRLAYFEACAEDEKNAEAETREVEEEERNVERQQQQRGRQQDAKALLDVDPPDETNTSSQSAYSHVEHNGDAHAIQDGLFAHRNSAEERAEPISERTTRRDSREEPEEDGREAEEAETWTHHGETDSLADLEEASEDAEHDYEAEQPVASPSPPSVPLPPSPLPAQGGYTSPPELAVYTASPVRASGDRSSSARPEPDVVQMAEQQAMIARMMERMEALEKEVTILREKQELHIDLSAMERDMRRLRERQDALDRRMR